jgi:hypothetical protein
MEHGTGEARARGSKSGRERGVGRDSVGEAMGGRRLAAVYGARGTLERTSR